MAAPEWIVHDAQTLRAALDGMRRKRKLSWENLFHKLSGRAVTEFIKGRQENIRSDSLLRAISTLEFELVIREPSTSKAQRRLEVLRAEREASQQALLRQVAEEEVVPTDRDEQGRLTRPLTDAERVEVEAALDRYYHP